MVVITFKKTDKKAKELVDDYFWFKYYIEVFQSDFCRSEEVKKIIKNSIYHENRIETFHENTKDHVKVLKELSKLIKFYPINKKELNKFIRICNNICHYYQYMKLNYDLFHIVFYINKKGGVKGICKKFKSILIDKYRLK